MQLDSLKEELSRGWDQAIRIDMLNQIAKGYEHISVDSSILYANKALFLARETGHGKGQLDAYSTLVLTLANQGQFDKARKLAQEGLQLAEELNRPLYIARLSSQLGRAYGRQGSYHGALHYFKEALRVNEQVGDAGLNASLHNSLGSIYVFLEEYDLAADYYNTAMQLYAELGDEQNLSRLHNNIAGNFYYMARWDEALDHYQQALNIYKEMGLGCLEVVAMYNIGGIYLKLNDLTKADEYLKTSYQLGQSCNVGDLNVHMLHDLGILAEKQGRDREAINKFEEAMEALGVQKNYYTLSVITKTIYEFYDKRHDSAKALYFLELHNEAEDSLRTQADLQKIAKLTSEYEFNKEREALKAQQERAELTLQSKIASERSIRNLVIVVAIFLIVLALNYYRTSNIRKQANLQLVDQNQLILHQKQALEDKTGELTQTNHRLNKLSEFKENLTHMIAHDLKNALNSILAASRKSENRKMQIIHQSGSSALGLITNMLDVHKFEETDMVLNKTISSISHIIEEARLQVYLLLQLKKLELIVDQEEEVILEVDKDIVLRVLVNLLTNAIKYSKIGDIVRLSVSFSQKAQERGLHIEVQDFGEGISKEDLPRIFDKHWSGNRKNLESDVSTGLGLTFCKMAVEAHKGEVYAQSSQGKGTVFVIHLPAMRSEELQSADIRPESVKNGSPNCRSKINETLRPFAKKVQSMAVHEVSRISTVLREIRALDIESNWPRELEIAMYQGDQESFDQLVSSLLEES